MPSPEHGPGDSLEALAEEFASRLRRGEPVTIEDYAARHPSRADEIRALFPTIQALERARVQIERPAGGRASVGPVRLRQLGEFHILREIGRGGMGVVYEARQEPSGRRVALKVLPRSSSLDGQHLRRFLREARTAARLRHANIVPVLAVGEQDRFHYYAMGLIDGVGLDRLIQRLRTDDHRPTAADAPHVPTGEAYWPFAANLGLQAARALEYAHSRRVLHRDIKPGNLLLDRQGTLWVADFGLAKADDQERVSRTGDVVGTLRYMAPEQFHGRPDARSDIYSLGLTLYELLTLTPAFEDEAVKRWLAGNASRTLSAPRLRNAALLPDLEAIILQAAAEEPRQRYQTAAELAADLQRFLDKRPVQARRTSGWTRLWRWCRRCGSARLLQ